MMSPVVINVATGVKLPLAASNASKDTDASI